MPDDLRQLYQVLGGEFPTPMGERQRRSNIFTGGIPNYRRGLAHDLLCVFHGLERQASQDTPLGDKSPRINCQISTCYESTGTLKLFYVLGLS
jgi:hypothetical protein